MTQAPDSPTAPQPNPLPAPSVRKSHISIIWLVPVVAAVAGGVLVVRTYLNAGPTITMSFETAEGLEAGKTEVKYKNVVMGRVKKIALTPNHNHVLVTVDLSGDATSIAVEDTRFWVERPRIGLGGVSGINTLLSGAFIGVDIGKASKVRTEFVGMEKPPAVTRDQKGRAFTLRGGDSGSLSNGSPLYYRRIPVGNVASTELSADGKQVTLKVFVDSPYDRYVSKGTRFWNASGVDLAINADGLKLNTQSLATVLAGGIAFETPEYADTTQPADEKTAFELHNDRAKAFATPDQAPIEAHIRFLQSIRGLAIGAQVDFQGIAIGTVKSIALDFDPERKGFHANVVADLYLERLGPAYLTLQQIAATEGQSGPDIVQHLVRDGLRAQLRTGNLILGQAYIALDFFKNGKPSQIKPQPGILRIPSEPGGFEEAQQQIQDIIRKLNSIPFEDIGNNLRTMLSGASSLISRLDREIAPEARKLFENAQKAMQSLNDNVTSPDGSLQQSARATLEQVKRAAYSLRALSDYLERHPESLIRGKSTQEDPPAGGPQKK